MNDELPSRPVGSTVKEGIIFWERGRIWYNVAQLLVTLVVVLTAGPRAHFFGENLTVYLQFALVANILYCSAYAFEFLWLVPALQRHAIIIRQGILVLGILFACLLAIIALDDVVLREGGFSD